MAEWTTGVVPEGLWSLGKRKEAGLPTVHLPMAGPLTVAFS